MSSTNAMIIYLNLPLCVAFCFIVLLIDMKLWHKKEKKTKKKEGDMKLLG